jgi:hypothetical protein
VQHFLALMRKLYWDVYSPSRTGSGKIHFTTLVRHMNDFSQYINVLEIAHTVYYECFRPLHYLASTGDGPNSLSDAMGFVISLCRLMSTGQQPTQMDLLQL